MNKKCKTLGQPVYISAEVLLVHRTPPSPPAPKHQSCMGRVQAMAMSRATLTQGGRGGLRRGSAKSAVQLFPPGHGRAMTIAACGAPRVDNGMQLQHPAKQGYHASTSFGCSALPPGNKLKFSFGGAHATPTPPQTMLKRQHATASFFLTAPPLASTLNLGG